MWKTAFWTLNFASHALNNKTSTCVNWIASDSSNRIIVAIVLISFLYSQTWSVFKIEIRCIVYLTRWARAGIGHELKIPFEHKLKLIIQCDIDVYGLCEIAIDFGFDGHFLYLVHGKSTTHTHTVAHYTNAHYGFVLHAEVWRWICSRNRAYESIHVHGKSLVKAIEQEKCNWEKRISTQWFWEWENSLILTLYVRMQQTQSTRIYRWNSIKGMNYVLNTYVFVCSICLSIAILQYGFLVLSYCTGNGSV